MDASRVTVGSWQRTSTANPDAIHKRACEGLCTRDVPTLATPRPLSTPPPPPSLSLWWIHVRCIGHTPRMRKTPILDGMSFNILSSVVNRPYLSVKFHPSNLMCSKRWSRLRMLPVNSYLCLWDRGSRPFDTSSVCAVRSTTWVIWLITSHPACLV